MILHLKNRNVLALAKMVKECKSNDGVPSYIEIDPAEAWSIMKEVRDCIPARTSFKFTKIIDSDAPDPKFVLYSKDPIAKEDAEAFIGRWMRGEYAVLYGDIPLRVIKKVTPIKPTPPPGRILKEGENPKKT